MALLEEQNATREPDLVPVRHGRMMVSPFTFYRGAAKIMASDLAGTPTAGFTSQLCGDAHLSNFGVFASPERRLMFDLNDFDETLPGPFEYDVKRMAASFTIAARNNGLTKAESTQVDHGRRAGLPGGDGRVRPDGRHGTLVRPDVRGRPAGRGRQGSPPKARTPRPPRTAQGTRQGQSGKDVKAAKAAKPGKDIGAAQTDDPVPGSAASAAKQAEKNLNKARTRDSLQALSKLAERVDGQYRIVSQPPIVVPIRDIEQQYGMTAADVEQAVHDQFRDYRATLDDDRRHLLEKFQVIDIARKVVGVGSVGTRAFIVLLQGRDDQDPLFLQVKEATRSVLEDHLPHSRYRNPGERVVRGQRMMQAASDIFLGWTKGVQENRYLYWRQLRDMKGSALVDTMSAFVLEVLRRDVRVDPGPRARPIRRPGRHRRLPRRRQTSSTPRSPTSPAGTPTRTRSTTRPSSTPSTADGSPPSKEPDHHTNSRYRPSTGDSNHRMGWLTPAGVPAPA